MTGSRHTPPRVSVALFTADLRLRDNPVLRAALASADQVVPLFVRDERIDRSGFAAPNRRAFLADCLAALDEGLRQRGGRLVLRHGDVAEETARVVHESGAHQVHVAADVSGYAQRREERLRTALEGTGCALHVHDAVVTVLAPGAVTPSGGRDHFAVFTPYYRRWRDRHGRTPLAAPRSVPVPEAVRSARLPRREEVSGTAPGLPRGGEPAGRERWAAWRRAGALTRYGQQGAGGQDDLAGDATSRLSPHLHFGTLSAAALVHEAAKAGGADAEAFVRQLAWRDFHHQVLAARPSAAHTDYRPHGDAWRTEDGDAAGDIAAWREGRTGYPIVDAGMRQLLHEGWMHNRARLLAASFLTKTLYVDWRVGAAHFLAHLVDGDVANNQLNWQWAAGTGTDTRPNRVLNPLTQAAKYDPDGTYVRRWVPQLAGVAGSAVHRPWRLPDEERAGLDYPHPIVDLAASQDRFRSARTG
ncbi:cryptochrome/photolyase family protein [Streptomyces sp. NRRL F-6602]|uniref:cryptochrome/photolyase family protein n=1 Tax=Streptomyces sp. SID1143 TaxID=3425889 RepID=UPI0006B68C3E|nr:deoxyribodipyrimidine photolyase [Streptomyces sp. NRRL F-6602]